MNRVLVSSALAAVAVAAAGLLLWPRSNTNAQVNGQVGSQLSSTINAEGCTCSRPTTLGNGREQLSIYYCACPGVQCVLTATTSSSAAPPNLAQSCRTDIPTSGLR